MIRGKAKEIPFEVIEDMKLKFNKSLIPYVVDFSQAILMDSYFYKLIESKLVKVDF